MSSFIQCWRCFSLAFLCRVRWPPQVRLLLPPRPLLLILQWQLVAPPPPSISLHPFYGPHCQLRPLSIASPHPSSSRPASCSPAQRCSSHHHSFDPPTRCPHASILGLPLQWALAATLRGQVPALPSRPLVWPSTNQRQPHPPPSINQVIVGKELRQVLKFTHRNCTQKWPDSFDGIIFLTTKFATHEAMGENLLR